jgi:hypothetical protein
MRCMSITLYTSYIHTRSMLDTKNERSNAICYGATDMMLYDHAGMLMIPLTILAWMSVPNKSRSRLQLDPSSMVYSAESVWLTPVRA